MNVEETLKKLILINAEETFKTLVLINAEQEGVKVEPNIQIEKSNK